MSKSIIIIGAGLRAMWQRFERRNWEPSVSLKGLDQVITSDEALNLQALMEAALEAGGEAIHI